MTTKLMISMFLFTFSVLAFGGDPLASAFENYGALQGSLASDDFDASKTHLAALTTSVANLSDKDLNNKAKAAWSTQISGLKSALESAAQAADITALRTHFEPISTAMITLYKEAHLHGFSEFHCPMALDGKGANWLQKDETIANPYFGSSMLRCGAKVAGHSHGDHQH